MHRAMPGSILGKSPCKGNASLSIEKKGGRADLQLMALGLENDFVEREVRGGVDGEF